MINFWVFGFLAFLMCIALGLIIERAGKASLNTVARTYLTLLKTEKLWVRFVVSFTLVAIFVFVYWLIFG
ncbi:hypothetical protein V144x_10870 [Gimesia aquarii]|uniref:Uncharacterized protein n=1 Tax=Gimesia aquarii TaxID=2527964 RepID=A0A517VRJ8_9PLAN|nr:hypothetical protein V144x_10870 [Gimesia aquarii]